jgi:hypothetical protein
MHWDDWQWLDDFSQDPEYAHTVLYVSRTYFSCIQNQSFGPKILTHINRATHQLQTLLCEGSPVITDGTMLTVLGLALVSLNFGDLEAAKKHVSGMRDLIRFRGGIQTLSQKHSLQIKCCRYVFFASRVARTDKCYS